MRLLFLLCLLSSAAAARAADGASERSVDERNPAYRVGSATSRIALLPVRCDRDVEAALCRAIGESLAVEIQRDPRLQAVNPADLEVLMGAQAVQSLSSCESEDCFSSANLEVDAAYMVALAVGRIGDDATLIVRMVDLKRGVVIDRDEARAPFRNERQVDLAARSLVMDVLTRRGLTTPVLAVEEEGSPGLFIAGVSSSLLGVAAAAGGGALGAYALVTATALEAKTNLTPDEFAQGASTARLAAIGGDALLIGGGVLVATGIALMVVGSL